MKTGLTFIFALTLGFSALGQNQKNIFATSSGAINGYDAVAYFMSGQPTKGDRNYRYEWNGVSWYFSSLSNLNEFKGEPEKFAPQYGGYCAYGTAQGHKAPTEPNAWTIVNGKLYLNYSKEVQSKWKSNQQEFIKEADELWPEVKNQPFN